MKRVLPLLILVKILELLACIWFSIYICSFKTYKLSKDAILDYDAVNCTLSIQNMCMPCTFKNVSLETYKDIYTQRQIKCRVGDRHCSLILLDIMFIGYFITMLPLTFIDLSESYYSRYTRGCRFEDGILSDFRHEIYNCIDEYDFTPWKEQIRAFWGY